MLKMLKSAFMVLALFACAPQAVLAADDDIGLAIALVNKEMAKAYPGNAYRFADNATLAYGYRVIFVGIDRLLDDGYSSDGTIETSGRPDAIYDQAQVKLQHVSIDLGQYYGINRGILNTFPGQVYLELLAHPPATVPVGSKACPDISAELSKIRAVVDAIEAKSG